jgi:hypothetical protein
MTAEERKQWPDLVEVDFGGKGMAEDHAFVYGQHLTKLAEEYREALGRPEQQLNRALLAFVGVVQIAGIPDFGEQA